MLKKVMVVVLALSILLCFASCGKEAEPAAEPTPDPKTTPEYHSTEKVQERGVLTIGTSTDSKNNYLIPDDPETYGDLAGTRDGYVPEMCRRIAEDLGVEVEFVEYETLEAQLQAVRDGDVDLAADNFTINEERLAIYEMTDNFMVAEIQGDQVFLSTNPQPLPQQEGEIKENSGSDSESAEEAVTEPEPREMIQSEEDLAHARIAAIKGSAQVTNTAAMYPEADIYELADNEAILEALVTGEVDAGVFTTITQAFADQIVEAINEGTVEQSSYDVTDPNYIGTGLILMKGNVELCQSINEIISTLMDSGWLLECYNTEEAEAAERGIG